jgi:LmbE family N-acetylglucosaminyl deacetylase
MSDPLKLMCVLAHPDDESLGTGGVLAKYAAEGIETYLVTATRGERGWSGDAKDNPGLEALGRMREAELRCAAQSLGVREVSLLDYVDGDLDQAPPSESIAKIVRVLRRVRPQVVVTFGPDGVYGHPDHIAICQFTTAAIVSAADPNYQTGAQPPHGVSKLYYMEPMPAELAAYQSVFGDLVMHIDGVERRGAGWPEWALTTVVDTADYWPTVWKAVSCHQTQISVYGALEHLPEEHHRALWGCRSYYRAYSTVNGGRAVEQDLFEGLRRLQ